MQHFFSNLGKNCAGVSVSPFDSPDFSLYFVNFNSVTRTIDSLLVLEYLTACVW